MALDQFVTTVKTLSNQRSLTELCEYLNKQSAVLSGNLVELETVYESLDPSQHSLGCLAVLAARLQGGNVENWDLLLARIDTLIAESNEEQIRFSSHILAELCHLLSSELVKHDLPIRGIALVTRAINKLQPNPCILTSVHSDLAKLCLKAKCFGPILPILDQDITEIHKDGDQFEAMYLLLYFYYGGCIYLAIKDYEKALYYLEVGVTCPTAAVSHIMLEAYKKYQLVALIVHGDKPKDSVSLPKFTSPIVNKFLKPLCSAYTEIVNAFYLNSAHELRNVFTKYRELFETDGNLGLVNQVVQEQTRTNIKRLTKTFVTLSLADVASRVGLETPSQAEREIVEMIKAGSIHATISQQDGMVRFHLNPESYQSPDMLRLVEESVTRAINLDKQVEKLTEDVMKSNQYIKKLAGAKEEEDDRMLSSNSAVSSGSTAKLPGYSM